MTIKELIKDLENFDPELEIFVDNGNDHWNIYPLDKIEVGISENHLEERMEILKMILRFDESRKIRFQR